MNFFLLAGNYTKPGKNTLLRPEMYKNNELYMKKEENKYSILARSRTIIAGCCGRRRIAQDRTVSTPKFYYEVLATFFILIEIPFVRVA